MTNENLLPHWAVGPKKAIDDAIYHYFENLVTSPRSEEEIIFLSKLIESIEPWLFMTDPSLNSIHDQIESDIKNVNLIYSLTSLFDIRFNPNDPAVLKDYIDRLAAAFGSPGHGEFSMVPGEYASRVPDVRAMADLLSCNKHLVMLGTLVMFFDTNILAAALPSK